MGSGTTLKSNEIEYIIKVIKSSQNTEILLKVTTKKFNSQGGGFIGPSMRVGLLLLKNVLTPLAKSVLMLLGLTATASATDAAIQKKRFGSGVTKLIISN